MSLLSAQLQDKSFPSIVVYVGDSTGSNSSLGLGVHSLSHRLQIAEKKINNLLIQLFWLLFPQITPG